MLATIEWNKIGELLWVAPLAALAVSGSYAVFLLAMAKADDHRRNGSPAAVVLYSAITLPEGGVPPEAPIG